MSDENHDRCGDHGGTDRATGAPLVCALPADHTDEMHDDGAVRWPRVWHADQCPSCGVRATHAPDCLLRHAHDPNERYAWHAEAEALRAQLAAVTKERDDARAARAAALGECHDAECAAALAGEARDAARRERDRLRGDVLALGDAFKRETGELRATVTELLVENRAARAECAASAHAAAAARAAADHAEERARKAEDPARIARRSEPNSVRELRDQLESAQRKLGVQTTHGVLQNERAHAYYGVARLALAEGLAACERYRARLAAVHEVAARHSTALARWITQIIDDTTEDQ